MSEDRVEAVERALTILEAFREGEEALSLAALAEKTGFYKSTILRLAASLERFGYLAREPSGLFRLGPSLWRLGSLYRRSFDLGEHVRPELRRLVEATTETASFYVREGNERVCLYRLNSPRAGAASSRRGCPATFGAWCGRAGAPGHPSATRLACYSHITPATVGADSRHPRAITHLP